jgi:4-amino-4-deoxy-L-arabinose transferase-like glycosyltransferase
MFKLTDKYLNQTNLKYLLYILAVLPVFIFRDFTFDNELRYLSIADEALRNGSVFTFTNHGLLYADKPPLYLWIVMLGKVIFGTHCLLFLGIFSFLPALVVLYIMDKWVKENLSETQRLAGQMMLLTSGYFLGAGLVLRMDMLMCMFIVLALYTFFKIYQGKGRRTDSFLFPVYLFMAVFSKGPVGIIVPFISIVVFLLVKGEIKAIGRYCGWKTWLVLFAFCLIWFTGVYLEGGSGYLDDLLFNQTVNRAVNSFHHKEPVWYYLISFWYTLAPWSLLYAGMLLAGLKKKLITTDLELFFLSIIIPTFITLSLISAKLQIYMLPVFPFIAYLTILWLAKLKFEKWIAFLIGVPAIVFCVAFPAAFIGQFLVDVPEHSTIIISLLAALSLSISGFMAIRKLAGKDVIQSVVMMSVGLLCAVFVVSFAVPSTNSMIGMGTLCQQAKKEGVAIQNYYCFNMPRGENLDVYLAKVPKNLLEKDLLNADSIIQKPAILFISREDLTRNNTLQKYIPNEKRRKVGNYYYVIIE